MRIGLPQRTIRYVTSRLTQRLENRGKSFTAKEALILAGIGIIALFYGMKLGLVLLALGGFGVAWRLIGDR